MNTISFPDPLPVLYADDHLVAVAKPCGMFVHKSAADRSATEFVVQRVRDQIGQFVYPVHRLDRATSGLLLLALSTEAASAMGTLFTHRQVAKTYHALVRGFPSDSGVIDLPMIPPGRKAASTKDASDVHQQAETHHQTRQQFEVPLCSDRYPTTRCSLVVAKPITGRYHQIRRHFNYISHPVIGDTSHGDSRQNVFFRKHFAAHRLMLAAVSIRFQHPFTEQQITIECPPDASFETVIQRLNKYAVDNT